MLLGVSVLIVVTSVVTSAEATAAASTRSVFTGTSFVYNEVLAQKISAVQAVDRVARCSVICHFDKAKAPAALSDLVHNDLRRTYFPILCKELL